MNIVGYGGGTDSTAMLVGLWQHHVPVDLILFADPGAEQPHTYHYLRIMDQWLREHGMPGITRVWYTDRQGQRLTLEQECLRSASLPSIAYGWKKCSLKHKVAPQEKFCAHYPPCQNAWARGENVVKLIGYDAGEEKRRLGALPHDLADRKYQKAYPLMEWGWDRNRVHPGDTKRGASLTREVLLLFLPLDEAKGDPDPLSPIPRPAGKSVGDRGSSAAQSPYCEGIGPKLCLAGFH